MKVNISKCLIIILVSSTLGLVYNFLNPAGIKLISPRKEIKWASDSLITSSLKNADTIDNKVPEKPIEDKSPLKKKTETVTHNLKPDSIKQKPAKQQIKNNTDEDEGFAEPIGINLEQAHMLYEMGFTFIDARDESEYKAGHIKGAINLPIYDFDKNNNAAVGITKSQTIVCYCGGTDCDLSTQLSKKLFSLGYRNNYIFIGGWEQWKAAGYKVE